MSINQFLDAVPFSVSGLQNLQVNTINGGGFVTNINVAGQTGFLSWNSTTETLTLIIPTQNGVIALGLLSSSDWITFDGKENTLTFTSPLTRVGNTISFDFSTTNIWTGSSNTFQNQVIVENLAQLTYSFRAFINRTVHPTLEFFYVQVNGDVGFFGQLNPLFPLPAGGPVWKITSSGDANFITTYVQNTFVVENLQGAGDVMQIYRDGNLFPTEYLFFTNTGSLGYNPGAWFINRLGEFVGSGVTVSDININGSSIFFHNPITTANSLNTLSYNTISKQVGFSPSLLGTNNTFTQTNFFTGDVIIGNNGRLSVNKGDGIPATIGSFTVCFEGYAPTWDVSAWTDRFALFSHGNGVGRIEPTSSALGFCQLGDTENFIVSLRPSIVWMNTTIAGNNFSIKYQGQTFNTCTFDNFTTTWFEPNGDTMSYLVRNGVTNLKWVVFRTPTSFAFYDTTANALGTTSDLRTKKNIRAIDIEKSKQFILSITPSIFQHKDGDVNDTDVIGFIAQDILLNAKTEAQKNIVSNWRPYEEAMAKKEEPKDMLGVCATLIIPELVGTIQLLNKQMIDTIEKLETENKTLLERLEAIELKMKKLMNTLGINI